MKANNAENNWNSFITDNDDLMRVCMQVKELLVMREAHAIQELLAALTVMR